MQAAVYDAVQAIGGRYKLYKVEISGASGSPEAAVAKAARDVLISIFPDKLESPATMYRGYLVKEGVKENDPGVAVGEKAAVGIITAHASNVRVPNPSPDPGFSVERFRLSVRDFVDHYGEVILAAAKLSKS